MYSMSRFGVTQLYGLAYCCWVVKGVVPFQEQFIVICIMPVISLQLRMNYFETSKHI